MTLLRVLTAALLSGAALAQQLPPPTGGLIPPRNFPLVDNVRGTLVSTNAAPVRPMVADPVSGGLWTVNTSRSTIERFVDGQAEPVDVVPVPWGPVSIARWANGDDAELLVVCRNTWGLLRIDEATLGLEGFIGLRAEPSDIVVDGAGRAFVTCMGADAVAQIDLTGGEPIHYYAEGPAHPAFRMKSPYFLALDGAGVRVAPLHSGNNTTFQEPGFITGGAQDPVETVVRLTGSTKPLPDEDIFHIDPATKTVSVVETGVGTLLFAHGRHPFDDTYWVLNTEAKNDKAQSEPELEFDFVDNRATLIDEVAGTRDDVRFDPGEGLFQSGPPETGNVVGQPFALAFHPSSPITFVAGLLTDNVVMLDDEGGLILEIDLPEGSIPRGLLLGGASNDRLYVHCWGTAAIEVFDIDYALEEATKREPFAMFDPTPLFLKNGRRHFFDGHNSAQTNVSCASCHVDAGTDFLLWNLSGKPYDDKGPMVTQTLVGLERVGPFHWRGERTLAAFNERGVPGLLGGIEMSPTQFDEFEAWLFSLNNPANPRQLRTRKVASNKPVSSVIPDEFEGFLDNPFAEAAATGGLPLNAVGGNGVAGMIKFQDTITFENRFACGDCHTFPVGTNNDIFPSGGDGFPKRAHFKVTPFHELWRKESSMVIAKMDTSLMAQQPSVRSYLGHGLSHNAVFPGDSVRFAQFAVPSQEDLLDISSFIAQWDQGLGKAAHYAYLLTSSSPATQVQKELNNYLLRQARRGNCDIAVFGTSGEQRAAWYLDWSLVVGTLGADDEAFVVDSEDHPDTRSLNDFIAAPESALFVGLPVGMAERFAVDEDMDLEPNRDDLEPTAFGPGDDDGTAPIVTRQEVEWVTVNTARVVIETDEPTTLTGTYTVTGSTTMFPVSSELHSRVHNLLLTDGLRPSTPDDGDNALISDSIPRELVMFSLSFTVADVWDNPTSGTLAPANAVTEFFTLPQQESGGVPFEELRRAHILESPPVVTIDPSPAGWSGTVTLDAVLKQGPPPQQLADHLIFVVRLFRRIDGTEAPVAIADADITVDGVATIKTHQVAASNPVGVGGFQILEVPGPLLFNFVDPGAPPVHPAVLSFDLTAGSFDAEDTLIANVEAVVRTDQVPQEHPVLGWGFISSRTAFAQWDFPRTGEDNINNDEP